MDKGAAPQLLGNAVRDRDVANLENAMRGSVHGALAKAIVSSAANRPAPASPNLVRLLTNLSQGRFTSPDAARSTPSSGTRGQGKQARCPKSQGQTREINETMIVTRADWGRERGESYN